MQFPTQTSLLVALHISLAVWGVYHVLLYKRDPRGAVGWIIAIVIIPYGGPIAYSLFGINRVKLRARGLKKQLFAVDYEIGVRTEAMQIDESEGLRTIGHRVTGRAVTTGNRVEPLINGDVAYPHMLASIAQARERILLATYILKSDSAGMQFADALQQAQQRGVDVKVLVDGFGENYSWPPMSRVLRKLGIKVARFLPPRLLPPSIYFNLRNHRKLLVVDGRIAYAGGMNISSDHTGSSDRPLRVTDVHFALHGPVTGELAQMFYHDWQFTTAETRLPEKPAANTVDEQSPEQDMLCRLVPDSPGEELDALVLTIAGVISAARESIDIMTPYFLPMRELIAALQSAALRGVRVRVVLPQKNNLFFVHWANRNMLADLLHWNIEVFYQPAPFCHTKLLCIDNDYTLIGSANLDPRSLRLNFELGIEVFSGELNAKMRAHIDAAVSVSRELTAKELAERSIPVRLRDSAFALLSPYL
ncbi:MAG: cardiolipin synthase [Gammaproteobacteria bacterium]|nr:cardiolipin synthase [Gammaproteobacteria bacterium]